MLRRPTDPAFPSAGHPGLTLRDYIAAQALTGLLASTREDEDWPDATHAAQNAYLFADAMLKVSENPSGRTCEDQPSGSGRSDNVLLCCSNRCRQPAIRYVQRYVIGTNDAGQP